MEALMRASLVVLVSAVLLIAGAPVASAHADYRDSDPPDGGSVSRPPGEVWAEFTEQPVEGSTIVITDPCGQRVDRGDYRYQPFPINRITVSMSADKAGEYSATWTVTSDADGHTTRGTFTFTAGDGRGCPGAESGSKGSNASDPAARSTSTSSNDEAAQEVEAADAASGGGSERPAGKRGGKKARGKADRGKSEQVDLAQSPQERDADPVAEEEDIPLDWLIVGLLISALIGAAGGRVYVNIAAPRKRNSRG